MRDLILQALRESVKRYPDIKDYLNPDTLLVYWLGSVKIGEAPDDDIRRKDERRLERALVKFLEKQKARVLTYIRTHDMKGVQPSFWEDEISKLWDELGEDFVGIIMHGVNGGISLLPGGGTGLGIDEDKINMSLVQWGRKYRDKWLAKIEETSRQYVEEKISAWALSGDPLSTLIKSLDADAGGMFSKMRATRIAVTEVTRLHAMGNQLAWEETNVVKEFIWNTAYDELVCPICRANHGKRFPLSELGNKIPAHVNCRCWGGPVVDDEMFSEDIDRILAGGGGGGINTERLEWIRNGNYTVEANLNKGSFESRWVVFPDGSKMLMKPNPSDRQWLYGIDATTLSMREQSAYLIARALGYDDLVPYTYYDEKSRASYQLQVREADIALLGKNIVKDPLDYGDAAVFDMITAGHDRHGGNWMIDRDGKLYLIDNGVSLSSTNDITDMWNNWRWEYSYSDTDKGDLPDQALGSNPIPVRSGTKDRLVRLYNSYGDEIADRDWLMSMNRYATAKEVSALRKRLEYMIDKYDLLFKEY